MDCWSVCGRHVPYIMPSYVTTNHHLMRMLVVGGEGRKRNCRSKLRRREKLLRHNPSRADPLLLAIIGQQRRSGRMIYAGSRGGGGPDGRAGSALYRGVQRRGRVPQAVHRCLALGVG